jgi:hypothetical protein
VERHSRTPLFHILHPHLSLFTLLIHIIMAQTFQDGVQGISDGKSHMGYDTDLSDHTNPGASELAVTQLDPWYVLQRFDFPFTYIQAQAILWRHREALCGL